MLTNFTVSKLSAVRLAKIFCGHNLGSAVKTVNFSNISFTNKALLTERY